MAKEFDVPGLTSGSTYYVALIQRPSDGQIWYLTTPAFEAYNAAHFTSYAVALTELGATGRFTADFPSAIGAATIPYVWEVRLQAGGSPALSDAVVAAGATLWDGAKEVSLQAFNSTPQSADNNTILANATYGNAKINSNVLLIPTNPLTTLGTNAPANWLNAAAFAANSLNGKGDWLLSTSYTAPDNTNIGVAAMQATNAANSATTLMNRIGAFTGSGLNTILGFLRAIMRKDATLTPSDVGGTFDNTLDSLEAGASSGGFGSADRSTLNSLVGQVLTNQNAVALDGAITIIAGDDYLDGAANPSLNWTITDYTGPALSTPTVTFTCLRASIYNTPGDSIPDLTVATGTASLVSTTLTLKVPLTAAQTAALGVLSTTPPDVDPNFQYAVRMTIGGKVFTEVMDEMTVRRKP